MFPLHATTHRDYYQPRHTAKGPASHDAHRLGAHRDALFLIYGQDNYEPRHSKPVSA